MNLRMKILIVEEEEVEGATQNTTEVNRSSTSRQEMATTRDRIARRLARANGIVV